MMPEPRLPPRRRLALLLGAALALSLPLTPLPVAAELPVAPEKNPPGDIPDTQVFVTYRSDLGYEIEVPEGWARSGAAGDVRFVDKLDGVSVTLAPLAQAPTADWVRKTYVRMLEQSSRAVAVTDISTVTLKAGTALRVAYTSNSEPNPVTSKQVRLENELYLFWKDGRLAALGLYAPLGADNADQWRLMSASFRWR